PVPFPATGQTSPKTPRHRRDHRQTEERTGHSYVRLRYVAGINLPAHEAPLASFRHARIHKHDHRIGPTLERVNHDRWRSFHPPGRCAAPIGPSPRFYSMASADFDSPPGATRTAGQTSQTLVCHRWSTRSVNRFPHLFFAALVAFLTGPARDTGVRSTTAFVQCWPKRSADRL